MTTAKSLRSLLLLAGLLVSTALAVALVRTKAQQAELVRRTETVSRETTDLGSRAERLRAEVAGLAETEAGQRVRAAMVLSAAERARRSVGPRVARLKMQHEANPPPAPLPSPPTPKDGSMGMVFPELMANPEYARCLFVLSRSRMETVYRKVLEALGCDPQTVAGAIDLLTERELVRYDVRSLDPKAMGPAAGAIEQKLRNELEQQLRLLLGETNYARIQEPQYSHATIRKPDGTVERKSISFPGIPSLHVETRQRGVVDLLATRLSYSDDPLEPAQREALVTALTALAQKNEGQRMPSPEQWSEPDMSTVFKAVLKPGQLMAVEALQTEAVAYRQRSQLPKQ